MRFLSTMITLLKNSITVVLSYFGYPLKLNQVYFFGQFVHWTTFSFFSLYVVFNEIVLEQVGRLSNLLYDQAWFELKPAERRLFVLLIINVQRKVSLTTGFEDLTLEWYTKIIKSAYSMGLVLEEMVQK